MSFINFFLFLLLTIIYFSITYPQNVHNRYAPSKSLLVYKDAHSEEEINKISDIEHVKVNINEKYFYPFYANIPQFDEEALSGYGAFQAILSLDEINVIDGKKPENQNEVLVPVQYYPYSEYSNSSKITIINDKILNGKDLLDSEIKIKSEKNWEYVSLTDPKYQEKQQKIADSNEEVTFKIVGTYDSKANMLPLNTVLITKEAMDLLKSDIKSYDSSVDDKGKENITYNYYTNQIIQVDKYQNYKNVKSKLNELGFNYSEIITLTNQLIYMRYLPLLISVILLAIAFYLIYKFILKQHQYSKFNSNLFLAANVIINVTSLIIAFISYLIIYFIITNKFLDNLLFYNIEVNIPHIFNLILIGSYLVYIIYINKKISKKVK